MLTAQIRVALITAFQMASKDVRSDHRPQDESGMLSLSVAPAASADADLVLGPDATIQFGYG